MSETKAKTHQDRAEMAARRLKLGLSGDNDTSRMIARETRPDDLLKEARALLAATDEAADTCDRWAEESRSGGWSTHQVKANRELADTLRRKGAKLRAALALYPEPGS